MSKRKAAAAALKHEETRRKIVDMLKANLSTYEIGTALDISPRLVRQIVQETVVTSLTEMATEIGRMAVAMVERWWLFHRKAMEGDVSASAESDRIFDRLLTLAGHD